MKWIQYLAATAVFTGLLAPVLEYAQAADAEVDVLRVKFESIIQGLNDNSFDRFNRAISKKDMTARIFGNRLIEADVKKAFASDFTASVQGMFSSSFPKSTKEILGTLIDFQFTGNEGRAVVRYVASGYRYTYHVYELGLDAKGRMLILDWLDYYQGSRFSDEAGQALIMAMPSKPSTRNLLENKTLGEGEVFQVGELLRPYVTMRLSGFSRSSMDWIRCYLRSPQSCGSICTCHSRSPKVRGPQMRCACLSTRSRTILCTA